VIIANILSRNDLESNGSVRNKEFFGNLKILRGSADFVTAIIGIFLLICLLIKHPKAPT